MRAGMTGNEKLKPRERRLIQERNLHMADKIEKLLELHKTCFVMVGSGHLVGEESIVSLLESKGHTVEQLDKAVTETQEAPAAVE